MKLQLGHLCVTSFILSMMRGKGAKQQQPKQDKKIILHVLLFSLYSQQAQRTRAVTQPTIPISSVVIEATLSLQLPHTIITDSFPNITLKKEDNVRGRGTNLPWLSKHYFIFSVRIRQLLESLPFFRAAHMEMWIDLYNWTDEKLCSSLDFSLNQVIIFLNFVILYLCS